jgi:hypothetical protein
MQLRISYDILCVHYIYIYMYVYVRILSYIIRLDIRLDDLAKSIMKFNGRNLNPNIMWVSQII